MAKITTSAFIDNISGKHNGSVFKRVKSGLVMQKKSSPRNKRSISQQDLRIKTSYLSRSWYNLSSYSKKLWNLYASNKGSKTSGFNEYLGLNNVISFSKYSRPGLFWSDLGQQASETGILCLCYLSHGIVLAGSYSNGKIFRSTDYGSSWSDLGQQFGEGQINCLSYLGNGIVIAGTTENCRLLRSTDYGLNWSNVRSLDEMGSVKNTLNLGNGICLAFTDTDCNCYRSTDYGQNWSLVDSISSEGAVICSSHIGNGIVIAGTQLDGNILRSTDYGLNWSDLGQQFSQDYIYSIFYLEGGVCLAGTGTGGKILRSTDYGLNWSDLGQQASQSYIYCFAGIANSTFFAGTSTDAKILISSPSLDVSNPISYISDPPPSPSTPESISGFSVTQIDSLSNRISWNTPSDSDTYICLEFAFQVGISSNNKESWTLISTFPSDYPFFIHTHGFPSDIVLSYRAHCIDSYGRKSPPTHTIKSPF